MLIDSIRFRVRRSNPIDSDQIIPSISHIIIAHFNRSRVIFQRLILGLFGKTEPVFFLPIEWPLVSIIESVRFDRWRFRGGIERILRRPRARIASRAPSTKNRPSPFTQKLRKRKKNRWTRLFVLFCFVLFFTEFYRVWKNRTALITLGRHHCVSFVAICRVCVLFLFFFAGGIHRLLGSVSTAPHYRWIMCRV